MRDERARAVVAKGVYAYAHTFWDNDDDDEDGERESKEERRNRMNGKGERGRPGHGGDCFCIDEIWGYEDDAGQEENCYASEECSLSRPNCHHTRTAPHRMQAMSRRIEMEVKHHEFPLLGANVGHTVGRKRPRPSRNVDDYCAGRPRTAADRDIILILILIPILLDWGNIKLVVWPHDSGVFLCSKAALR